ncbi:TetR/AcrR family transcriptional regulator, partial [Zavarzinia sp.]|uniref:TetR/AcrR family transcriptional regulator n=1 Tax=Zavarzinia sp. TaxID=2027920 RepID=UPI003561B9C8
GSKSKTTVEGQGEAAASLPAAGAPRRRPVQARGRKRVDTILGAAERLIRDKGVDALKMSEIAAEAEVPIGSIYQFFADRGAILRALAERYMEQNRRMLETTLRNIKTIDDAKRKLWQAVDQSFETHWTDHAFRDVWFGLLADRDLQKLNQAAARRSAAIIVGALKGLFSHLPEARLTLAAETMVLMSEGLVRATSLEDVDIGKAKVGEFKHLIALYLRDLSIGD